MTNFKIALQDTIPHYHFIKCIALSAETDHCHFKNQVDSQCVRTSGIRKIHRGTHKKSKVEWSKAGKVRGMGRWEQESEEGIQK